MRAIRIHQPGGPEVMRLEEVELPPPGKGEVRLRQRAIGVNYMDVYQRTGFYAQASLPFTPGGEGAGDVVEVGPEVTGLKPGDRVVYSGATGGYADERNIEARLLFKLPKSISYETAAAMMLKGLTAQYLLRQTYRVKEGDTMLVHAAAGGVGLILCQWGKALGATVIGCVGSAEKAALAKKAGAKHTILYRDEDFPKRVDEITKGAKCHVAYDGVGKATFPASLDCLRPFGMFVSFGSASGGIEAFNIGLLAQKGSLFATRPTLFTFLADRARAEKMARELFRVVERGDVKIQIGGKWPLAQAADAHAALEKRETTGSLILLP
ncbi:MAG: quinone oxidoreductase [Roseiarcus sp.]|uniref:quinone oxidoreductase family protein n=1 Tax=Roseiarcus sp. TaxID=1969460 RepID=UPI003C6A8779